MPAQLRTWRAEVVGSLLRPADLVAARKKVDSGGLAPADFKSVEDAAVRAAIELQQDAGIDVVTDGEFRRYAFYGHLIDSFEGFDREGARRTIDDFEIAVNVECDYLETHPCNKFGDPSASGTKI